MVFLYAFQIHKYTLVLSSRTKLYGQIVGI
nr:unnamed protein product [Callosobruchus chinensis]CAH7751097.1 unnamed protein product [Callosobruchus chinensis]CAH7769244.1 unnamed protein product [Callosobruchus chinensis]